MTVYNLNISNEQTQLLYLALERIASAPGYYSLQGNHCTTIAFQCLESAGFKFKRDYNMFLNEAIGGEEQYQGLNLTPSRFIYHLDKKRKEDPSQFNDVFYITVPKKK